MNQDLLRTQLISILEFGMKLGAIAKSINVNIVDLSRFKNGYIYLTKENAEKLKNYLDKVVIPT